MLAKAIERSEGRYSVGTVLESLLKRDMQLWVIHRADIVGAVVTQTAVYPTGLKALDVLFVAGEDLKDWHHLWSAIEQWGREAGCDVAETRCRDGWERVNKDWRRSGIELVKDLSDGQGR